MNTSMTDEFPPTVITDWFMKHWLFILGIAFIGFGCYWFVLLDVIKIDLGIWIKKKPFVIRCLIDSLLVTKTKCLFFIQVTLQHFRHLKLKMRLLSFRFRICRRIKYMFVQDNLKTTSFNIFILVLSVEKVVILFLET